MVRRSSPPAAQHNPDLQDLKSVEGSVTQSKVNLEDVGRPNKENKWKTPFATHDARKSLNKTASPSASIGQAQKVMLRGVNFPMELLGRVRVHTQGADEGGSSLASPGGSHQFTQQQAKSKQESEKQGTDQAGPGLNTLSSIKYQIEREMLLLEHENAERSIMQNLALQDIKFMPDDMQDLVRNWQRSELLS